MISTRLFITVGFLIMTVSSINLLIDRTGALIDGHIDKVNSTHYTHG